MKNENDQKKKNMIILVTGGLGFIGFNALQRSKKMRPDYKLVVVDSETYASQFMLDEKKQWCKENGVEVVKCDIRDTEKVIDAVVNFRISVIVNFAAESHVDNSIKNPNIFFETNVMGTVNLLNIAKKYDLRFHQIGTDEVYGITYPDDECYEDHALDPSSPYSSSKCSADLIALSYFKTFGTKVTVSRCTNNFGKFQHSEKLIPTIITKVLNDQKIPVYGKGDQRRHWIHVDEHNRAILDILENGKIGEVFNIAPSAKNYITNMQVIKAILKRLGKDPKKFIEHVKDRAAHDTSYYLYSLNYSSERLFKKDINEVVDWYVQVLQKDNK